jgi:hypothetical protein
MNKELFANTQLGEKDKTFVDLIHLGKDQTSAQLNEAYDAGFQVCAG